MTTIAWDGQIMAADTLAVDNWGLKEYCSKIFTGKDFVMGGAGSRHQILKWWRQIEEKDLEFVLQFGYPDFHKDDNDPAILLVDEKGNLWRHVGGLFLQHDRGYHAIGSGRDFALAAMHCERDARKAVEIAKIFDNNTGGDVQTVQVLPKLDRWPS